MQNKELDLNKSGQPSGFDGLGIHIKIVQALTNLGFKQPTPIQHQAIPAAIDGKDLIGIAQTGTGKTLAFGIPMIQRLATLPGKQGLIVLPTRELALQVEETLQKIGSTFGLKTAVLIGGASMSNQIRNIRFRPHIIIGTPGRINDHLERKTLNLQHTSILVLDEADLMFDMGFAPQIKKILALLSKDRQNMLFSATMPPEILKIATQHMQLPLRFEIAPQGTVATKVEHELFFARKDQRMNLLQKILEQNEGNALVFLRTKHAASKICKNLNNYGVTATEIHSNRSLNQRKAALEGFKKGTFRVLVATDIAARGIDIKGLSFVINYDLPENVSDYVHRIGRTGRAGMTGKAISFAMPDQKGKIQAIERLIKYVIPVSQMPGLPVVKVEEPRFHHQSHMARNQRRRGHQRRFSKRY